MNTLCQRITSNISFSFHKKAPLRTVAGWWRRRWWHILYFINTLILSSICYILVELTGHQFQARGSSMLKTKIIFFVNATSFLIQSFTLYYYDTSEFRMVSWSWQFVRKIFFIRKILFLVTDFSKNIVIIENFNTKFVTIAVMRAPLGSKTKAWK